MCYSTSCAGNCRGRACKRFISFLLPSFLPVHAPLLPALSPYTTSAPPLIFLLLLAHSPRLSLLSLSSLPTPLPSLTLPWFPLIVCARVVRICYGLVVVSFFGRGGNRLCACMCFLTRMHMYVLSLDSGIGLCARAYVNTYDAYRTYVHVRMHTHM